MANLDFIERHKSDADDYEVTLGSSGRSLTLGKI
jgi:hypothetical protein